MNNIPNCFWYKTGKGGLGGGPSAGGAGAKQELLYVPNENEKKSV